MLHEHRPADYEPQGPFLALAPAPPLPRVELPPAAPVRPRVMVKAPPARLAPSVNILSFCETGYWHCRRCYFPRQNLPGEADGRRNCERCGGVLKWHPPIF